MTLQMIALITGVVGAGVVFLVAFKWWSDGTATGSDVAILTVIYGGLIFGLCVSVGHPFVMVVTLVLLVCSIGWMLYQNRQTSLRSYYREKIQAYERAIRADPTNTAARTAMAEAYYIIGDLDRAIGALEVAAETGRLAMRENHRLHDWREQRDMRDSKTVLCRNCYSRNFWGATQCRVCRHPIDYAHRSWWEEMIDNRMNVRIAAAVVVWIIVFVLSLVLLPILEAAIIVGCVTLTGVGWLLLSSKS